MVSKAKCLARNSTGSGCAGSAGPRGRYDLQPAQGNVFAAFPAHTEFSTRKPVECGMDFRHLIVAGRIERIEHRSVLELDRLFFTVGVQWALSAAHVVADPLQALFEDRPASLEIVVDFVEFQHRCPRRLGAAGAVLGDTRHPRAES
jgi:hypothetical protein